MSNESFPVAVLEELRRVFADLIPFNRTLGMRLGKIEIDYAQILLEMREELVGNFVHGSLHGGVTASVLDTVGGLAAFSSVIHREDLSLEQAHKRLAGLGTIDLRIDYLRSGKGTSFLAEARVLRTGNKVAVSRMELQNQDGLVVAVGTGTYLVG